MNDFFKKIATGLIATSIFALGFLTSVKPQSEIANSTTEQSIATVSISPQLSIPTPTISFGGEPAQAFWGSVGKEIVKAEGYDLAKWCLLNPNDCTKPAQDTAKNIQDSRTGSIGPIQTTQNKLESF